MSIPTEAGWYWCKFAPDADWTVAEVFISSGGHLLACSATFEVTVRYMGTWGPRIPGPLRLAAMEELAAEDETCVWSDYDFYGCRHCNTSADDDGSITHDPDCPWKRAQEKQDADSD